jgi:hypothetical protein
MEHLSDISFDRAFARELPATEQQRMAAHLANCARCRERQSYLAEERAAFLGSAAAVALAAAVLLLLPMQLPSAVHTRIKGAAQVGFYVKHGAQVTRGRPDQVVHPGDVLRFTYSSPLPTHFALLGRDDRRASLFYPRGDETIALAQGTDVALDFGVEIDGEPGQERIFALFCAEPVALLPLLAALEQTSTLPPPAHCSVRELRLRKAVP